MPNNYHTPIGFQSPVVGDSYRATAGFHGYMSLDVLTPIQAVGQLVYGRHSDYGLRIQHTSWG